ncbi:hypothetical protein pipiens_003885 [Culex pipiens pipiens]|uniref:Uncharacterized protein n=1 Tax=Culex pipiens pipiens TaxID=38569 RepID=A0ABD1CRT9_CULPP
MASCAVLKIGCKSSQVAPMVTNLPRRNTQLNEVELIMPSCSPQTTRRIRVARMTAYMTWFNEASPIQFEGLSLSVHVHVAVPLVPEVADNLAVQ